jgi:RHS repeat-associated protein
MTVLEAIRQSRHRSAVTALVMIYTFLFALLPPRRASADGELAEPATGETSNAGLPELAAAGATKSLASFMVEPSTGAATARIDFVLPAARGMAQPSLALTYSSSGTRGAGGAGWSFNLPNVERRHTGGPPTYSDLDPTTGDSFYYMGEPLVLVCQIPSDACGIADGESDARELMPDNFDGWRYYRLEIERGSYLRFFLSPNRMTWLVQSKSGNTITLGTPVDGDSADVSATDRDGGDVTRVFRWNISTQYDSAGAISGHPLNRVTYRWSDLEAHPELYPAIYNRPGGVNDVGHVGYLTDIYDTPPATNAADVADVSLYAHHVRLAYDASQSVLPVVNAPVWRARPIFRVSRVDVTSKPFRAASGGAVHAARILTRRYYLTYEDRFFGEYLTSVQMEGRCSGQNIPENAAFDLYPTTCPRLPATTFKYSLSGEFGFSNTTYMTGKITPPSLPPATLNGQVLPMNRAGVCVPGDCVSDGQITGPDPGEDFKCCSRQVERDPRGYPTNRCLARANCNTDECKLACNKGGGGAGHDLCSRDWECCSGVCDRSVPSFLFDVDSDGLPDIVKGQNGGRTGQTVNTDTNADLWINSLGGVSNSLTQQRLSMPQSRANAANVAFYPTPLSPGSPFANLLIGNFRGDGRENIFWCAGCGDGASSSYALYTPTQGTLGWMWGGGSVTASLSLPHYNARAVAIADLNGDGLTDILQDSDGGTAGPPKVTASFTTVGNDNAIHPFANVVDMCLPLPEQTSWYPKVGELDQNFTGDPYGYVSVVDMNGDGLPDWTVSWIGSQFGQPTIEANYWPNRGDGTFGVCNGKDAASCSCFTRTHVSMGQTIFGLPAGTKNMHVVLHDVTGDGRADAIVVGPAGTPSAQGNGVLDDILVLPNNGNSFGNPSLIQHWCTDHNDGDTGCAAAQPAHELMFADMNGNGSDDVVVVRPSGAVMYTDFVDPIIDYGSVDRPYSPSNDRAGLLTQVKNGLGATTTIEYTTTTDLTRQARLAPHGPNAPPPVLTPQVLHVVKRVTTETGGPGQAEAAALRLVTDYDYKDPIYDGFDRMFVGFKHVSETLLGDSDSPTSVVDREYDNRHCVDQPQIGEPTSHWYNPGAGDRPAVPCPTGPDRRERAYRNLLRKVERRELGTNGTASSPGNPPRFVSTEWNAYAFKRLYVGVDGRVVRQVYRTGHDTFLYDTSLPGGSQGNTGPGDQTGVVVADDDADDQNNPIGEVPHVPASAPLPLQGTNKHVQRGVLRDKFGNALVRADMGIVSGGGKNDEPVYTSFRSQLAAEAGHWLWRVGSSTTRASASQPGTFAREASFYYDSAGRITDAWTNLQGTLTLDRTTGGLATVPPDASVDKASLTTLHVTYDAVGNAVQVNSPHRCEQVIYDADYGQLATSHTPNCGDVVGLSTFEAFDRGLGVATRVTGVDGTTMITSYDTFGRVKEIDRADPVLPSFTTKSLTVQYLDRPGGPDQIAHVTAVTDGRTSEAWVYTDGLGTNVATLQQADPAAGDGGKWIASGRARRNAKGLVVETTPPTFYDGAPDAFTWADTVPGRSYRTTYDAWGRVTATFGLDGSTTSTRQYHALAFDDYDAAAHKTSVAKNGHGQTIETDEAFTSAGAIVNVRTTMLYLPTGELRQLRRSTSNGVTYERWMDYDSMGRLVRNAEPNTSVGFAPLGASSTAMKSWRYAYNDAGEMVATSDARGCGENLTHDSLGRVLTEDFWPCTADQTTPYSAPAANGTGTEIFYRYDSPEPGQAASPFAKGKLTSISDRASHTRFQYDGRGRTKLVQRQLAKPGIPAAALADRYAPHWFSKTFDYDAADRVVSESTGAEAADVPLLAPGHALIQSHYTQRGLLASVDGDYGMLLRRTVVDADGSLLEAHYGDVGESTRKLTYDEDRSARTVKTATLVRAAFVAPTDPASTSFATMDALTFTYDALNQPKTITDDRDAKLWPVGAKPGTRSFEYDEFSHVTKVTYETNGDAQAATLAADDGAFVSSSPAPSPTFAARVSEQSFHYDGLGNITRSNSVGDGFFDRALGDVVHDPSAPNRLTTASLPGAAGGSAQASYDAAGNLTSLYTTRTALCPSGCGTSFRYEWDEIGQLARARRWDAASSSTSSSVADADLEYAYDAGGQRVLKTAHDAKGETAYTAEIFSTLRLNHATFPNVTGDYERSAATLSVYLAGLGRAVLMPPPGAPAGTAASLRVFLELGDHLGSTGVVVDRDTSELVERTTYTAAGATDSDFRPARWGTFREDYRFTGKEEDVEVGLVYFGARYYSPSLVRWISADPLAVHALGSDLNPYAYVAGRLSTATRTMTTDGRERRTVPPKKCSMESPSETSISEPTTSKPT